MTRKVRILLTLCFIAAARIAPAVIAQIPAAPAPAVVEGIVVRQGTLVPISGVSVAFISDAGASKSVTSDASGKFTVSLPAGRYGVHPSRTGFVRPRRSAGPANLTLTAGLQLKDVRLQLVATSVITGRVIDENGRPKSNAPVAAFRPIYENGHKTLSPCYSPSGKYVRTDETGVYRLFGLEPGEYFLAVSGDGNNCVIQYYPNVVDPADAILVATKSGDEIAGIDFHLTNRDRHTARFKVEEPPVPVASSLSRTIQIIRRSRNSMESVEINGSALKKDGDSYITPPLAAGSYDLYISTLAGRVSADKLSLNIGDRDIDAGTLVVRPMIAIPGRVVRSSSPLPSSSSPQGYVVRLVPIDGFGERISALSSSMASARVATDGTLVIGSTSGGQTIGSVAAGLYQIEVAGLPANTYVATARYGTREVLGAGLEIAGDPAASLEITIAGPGGLVEGTVRDAKKEPVADSHVVLIPAMDRRRSLNQFRAVVTDQNGTFSIGNVPPGDYGLLAWEDVDPGAWLDPEFLKDFELRATKITVVGGGSSATDIRVIPVAN